MTDLKSIWNQLNCDTSKLEVAIHDEHSIFEKLKNDKRLRIKSNPYLAIAIIMFTAFFGYILFLNNVIFDAPILIGIGFITLAGISISIFSQVIKMPLDQYGHDKSSMVFLKAVKEQLEKSKKMLVTGIILQFIFLSLGLYILIFYSSPDVRLGYVCTFFGVILGLGGAAIGGSIAAFNAHYKSTYRVINDFLID